MSPKDPLAKDELLVSRVLQIGVSVSSLLVLIGIILFLNQYHTTVNPALGNSFKTLTAPSFSFPHSPSSLVSALRSHSGLGFIVLGSLLLILTPVLRVATTILIFAHKRDRAMTAITVFVLSVLIGSFIIGVFFR
jgi:uncharacterized membrane protein